MPTVTTTLTERAQFDDWYVNDDLLHLAARHGIDSGEFDTPQSVADFFEKPYHYQSVAKAAAAAFDLEKVGSTVVVRALPAYTKVRFAVGGSKVCTALTRDLPQFDNRQTRRITNLDSGTEFFVEPGTEFDHFEIVEFESRG